MEQLTDFQIKEVQLEMLRIVDKICTDNSLRYCLAGGSLIGAVRHNGFIPWDDDIDLDMPRPDYERFKEILAKDDRYKIIDIDTDTEEKCYYAFGRLVDTHTILANPRFAIEGVGIDIFPLDGLPGDLPEARRKFNELMSIKLKLWWFNYGHPTRRRNPMMAVMNAIQWRYLKKRGITYLQNKLSVQLKKNSYEDSCYVCSIGGRYGYKEIFQKAYFDQLERHRFESLNVNIPSEYDAFLRQMYGDYMQLPPVEKQIREHGIVAYWRE